MAKSDFRGRFITLFRGLERAHGIYRIAKKANGSKKVEGKAVTVRAPVLPALWRLHFRGEQGLGIVPITDTAVSYFGAIDVDVYPIDIKTLEAQVAALGVPLLPTRTKSGGVHLYAFSKEGVPAELLRARLEEWAVALGFAGAEIFPKQNALVSEADVGNWINMPYFASDTGKTERFGVYKGEPLTLEEYVRRAERLSVTEEQLEELVIAEDEAFEQGPPCLQSLGARGFGEGQRNKGLFAVGVYLKKRYPDDWSAHLYSYNTRFMRPPLADDELKTTIKSLNRKDYEYSCSQEPIKSFCNRALCRKRQFGVGKGKEEEWGITIDPEVHRIDTVPPYWIVTINGVRMELLSDHLMQQRKFQELCLQKIALLPPPLAGDKWRAEVNKLISTAVAIEAPPDASVGGELRWYLEQFCTVYPQADTREELLTGKPYTEEGWVYFRAADFKRYLEAQHFRALQGVALYREMRALFVEDCQFWVGEQNLRMWRVPTFKSAKEKVDMTPKDITKGSM